MYCIFFYKQIKFKYVSPRQKTWMFDDDLSSVRNFLVFQLMDIYLYKTLCKENPLKGGTMVADDEDKSQMKWSNLRYVKGVKVHRTLGGEREVGEGKDGRDFRSLWITDANQLVPRLIKNGSTTIERYRRFSHHALPQQFCFWFSWVYIDTQ